MRLEFTFQNFACIDWSGAIGERHAGIAVAICSTGDNAPKLVRPGHRWSRLDVANWLLNKMPPHTLVGMDMSTSLPFIDHGAYFPGWIESPHDAVSLWTMVDRICTNDAHMSVASFVEHIEASRHFRQQGGRVGDLFEPGRGRLRRVELAQAAMGMNPYSNLNLIGAAQVGKSSLSGMRVLHYLRGRLPVWPIQRGRLGATGSLLVEIYTSVAALAAGRKAGRTKMRTVEELNDALASPAIASMKYHGSGAIADHSSDALLTAAWLRRTAEKPEFWHPASLTDEIADKEGWTFGVI